MLRRVAIVADWLRHRARLRLGNEAHAWGQRGEDLAHRYLQACGYRVVAHNWRTRNGGAEVDIVALDSETIVFVEVKTRATDAFGSPEEAVDETKRRHMIRAATEFLRVIDADFSRARFDIVSVLFAEAESVVHYRDAIPKPAYQYETVPSSAVETYGEPL